MSEGEVNTLAGGAGNDLDDAIKADSITIGSVTDGGNAETTLLANGDLIANNGITAITLTDAEFEKFITTDGFGANPFASSSVTLGSVTGNQATVVTNIAKIVNSEISAISLNGTQYNSITSSTAKLANDALTLAVVNGETFDFSSDANLAAKLTAGSVASGGSLTLSAGQAGLQTFTGNGSITVTAVDGSTNLASINSSLTHIANLKTGADISSSSTLGTVDNFNLENDAQVTMTKAQHDKLTVGSAGVGSANKITMSGAASFNAESSVETYQLDNTTNSITLSSNAHTVIGGTDADTILGGSGNDVIDGGTGIDSLGGGGGGDDFLFSAGDAYTDVNFSSTFETISDFTTGSDDIDVVGVTVNSLTKFDGVNLVSNKFDDALRGERAENGNAITDGITSNFNAGNVDAFFMYNVAGTGVGYLAIDMNADGNLNNTDIVILLSNGDQASDLNFANDFI